MTLKTAIAAGIRMEVTMEGEKGVNLEHVIHRMFILLKFGSERKEENRGQFESISGLNKNFLFLPEGRVTLGITTEQPHLWAWGDCASIFRT